MYEELIKRLRTAQTLAEFVAEDTAKMPNTIFGEAADAIDELSREIDIDNAAMTEMDAAIPRWIPVTEGLPGREWVLCKCRAKIHEVLSLRDGYWYHDPQHEYMSGFVTHWMTLPQAPKEET